MKLNNKRLQHIRLDGSMYLVSETLRIEVKVWEFISAKNTEKNSLIVLDNQKTY